MTDVSNRPNAQEITYLQALVEGLREVRETYVPLQAIADRWRWESELEGVSLLAMHSGIEEQENLTFTQQQMGVQLLDEVTQRDQVVVLGKPGSGKSTTLQFLAQHYAELALQGGSSARLPLLAKLSEYHPGQDIIGFLLTQLSDLHKLPASTIDYFVESIEDCLDAGRLVLLFDGLNELAEYRRAAEKFARFMRIYPKNSFVFAGRDADYRGELNIEHELYIDTLDDQRIVDFVDKHRIPKIDGRVFLQFLKDDGLVALARSPYLLSLMLRRAKLGRWSDLSRSRTDLFVWAVQETWAREYRRLGRDDVWIEDYIGNEVLIRLAWEMNRNHTTTIERINAEGICRALLGEIGRLELADMVLKQAVDAGILILSSRQQIRFQHQLLQDYFAACQLKRLFEDGELLAPFIDDLGWHEAIVLLAGLLGENVRGLVEAILTQPDDLFFNNLTLAARCLAEAQSALPSGIPRLIRTDLVDRLFEVFSEGLYTVLQRNAETALVEVGDSRVVSGLNKIIYTPGTAPYLQIRATRALGAIGSARARDLLIRILSDPTLPNAVRTRTAVLLGRIGGPEVKEALLHIVDDPDATRQVRQRSVLALGGLRDDEVCTRLVDLLRDKDEKSLIRELAAVALLNFPDSCEAQDALLGIVGDRKESRHVRGRASDVLARWGGEMVRELFHRILHTEEETQQVRARIALNLGVLGDPRDIPMLVEIAQNRDLHRRLRWNTTYALGYILRRVQHAPTIEMLSRLLKDESEDHFVRWTAAYALGMSRDEESLRVLARVVPEQFRDRDVKRRIIEAIGQFQNDEATEALIKIFQQPGQDAFTREGALLGLGKVGNERARQVLVAVAEDAGETLSARRRAVIALGTLGDVDEVALLRDIVHDENEAFDLRDAAFTALERISRSHRLRLYSPEVIPSGRDPGLRYRDWLRRLREILSTRFDAEELRTLCFDLRVDYDDLQGGGKTEKARELIAYLERRHRFHELLEVGQRVRPDIPWADLLEELEAIEEV